MLSPAPYPDHLPVVRLPAADLPAPLAARLRLAMRDEEVIGIGGARFPPGGTEALFDRRRVFVHPDRVYYWCRRGGWVAVQ